VRQHVTDAVAILSGATVFAVRRSKNRFGNSCSMTNGRGLFCLGNIGRQGHSQGRLRGITKSEKAFIDDCRCWLERHLVYDHATGQQPDTSSDQVFEVWPASPKVSA